MKKQIDINKALAKSIQLPLVKIDRKTFLKKELDKYFDDRTVNLAIEKNPAYAGIPRSDIDKIANKCIEYETKRVTFCSFGLGIPGGIAGAVAAAPIDISQYLVGSLRILQKLAYLYGFKEFDIKENQINDSTMNELIIFLGVMFGVQEATTTIKTIAERTTTHIAKNLANKALTATFYYPIIKNISQKLGYKMTKEIFARNVSKGIPILGGVIGGGLSFVTFRPCSKRLKYTISKLPICDPNTYIIKNDYNK